MLETELLGALSRLVKVHDEGTSERGVFAAYERAVDAIARAEALGASECSICRVRALWHRDRTG